MQSIFIHYTCGHSHELDASSSFFLYLREMIDMFPALIIFSIVAFSWMLCEQVIKNSV